MSDPLLPAITGHLLAAMDGDIAPSNLRALAARLIDQVRADEAEMQQAHAAALAAVERLPGHTAHAYIETSDWSGGQSAQVRFQQSEQGRWVDKGDVLTLLGNAAAAPRTLTRDGWWPFGSFVDYDFPLEFDGEGEDGLPIWERPDKSRMQPRTLTADCLHLAEMYVGQSSRDNEYGRRSPVIECLACGALRLDDETVPPNRLAGGDFDTSGQPRTLTADDPEPAVGSVVLDANGHAWQRHATLHPDDPEWLMVGHPTAASWADVLAAHHSLTLIHDGVATT